MLEKIDDNLFEFYEYAAAASGRPCVRGDGFEYLDLKPSPWASAVFRLDFPARGGQPCALRQGIEAGRIPNKVRLGPTSRPLEAERMLVDAGFVPKKASCGMTLELRSRRSSDRPRGLSIGLLESQGDYLDFARVVAVNLFGEKPESGPAFARVLVSMDRDRAFGFLARIGEQPVSSAYAFLDGEGTGGVYFVATDLDKRGRGYGGATVSAALDELTRRGASICILHATELGKRVYENLGFVEACRLPILSIPT